MAEQGRLLRRGLRTVVAMVRLHPRVFFTAVFGASVYACATVASSFVLGRVTDTVILPRFERGNVRTGAVVGAVAAIIGVGLVKAAGIIVRRIFATMANANVGATLRSQVVTVYQEVPYTFHQSNATGELLSHAGTDVEAATNVINPLPFATGVVVILVVAVAWLVATDVVLSLVGIVLFPTLMLLNFVYQRRVEAPASEAQDRLGSVAAVAHESFEGALAIKALGAEYIESDRFREVSEQLRDAKVRAATTRATFESMLDALLPAGIAVLLPLGALRISSGAVTVGDIVSFVSLFTILVWPLRLIGYVLDSTPQAVVGHERIARVLAAPQDPRHRLDANTAAVGGTTPQRGAALVVERLSFAYDADRRVIDDVTFTLTPGQTVAVVGATGSGKSTLLLLVAGLLDLQAGRITIDGRDLASYAVDELRNEMAIAFQEAFLFGESVEENVMLGVHDDARRDEVAALAGVTAFVERLPHGWSTVVGERGATLSGGQRQRVALARALARHPRLLLLDDATSAVDPTTEARILQGLRAHLTATTTLVVASRPSTIALADEVIYLDNGRLVAHGSHVDLMRRHHGYEELVRAYELDRADRGLQ
jgi:ATP-binding cassette subfamily B protein